MKKIGIALVVAAAAITLPRPAAAFCGFYVSGADTKLFNNATHVVLMREGTRTVLSMQNNYQGPPQDFAMVVPVPVVLQKENVKTLEKSVFEHIDQLSAPRLVEYWERNPCERDQSLGVSMGGATGVARKAAPMPSAAPERDLGVKIEAQFTVGEYDIAVLSAKDSGGLDTWLRQEKYKIPEGAAAYLEPYVQAGSKFFVARVDAKKIAFGGNNTGSKDMAALSPLRFHYDTETFSLPVRLGLMNSAGTQDLIVNILAKNQRYEVANYPNATIPTNFDVAEGAKTQFGTFYAALFDRALAKTPKVVVTEYAWDAGTCDPCPTPALAASELAVLGADVLPSASVEPIDTNGRWSRRPSGFVLTRLHARYAKESLGEDLVFRAAETIFGGREFRQADGSLEHDATVGRGSNNFQARYAVRHPWTGPIACANPVRGRWGGPPNGAMKPPAPAQNLAFAPRGKMQLASFVKGTIPDAFPLPGAVTLLGSPVVPVPPAAVPELVDAGAPELPVDAGSAAPPPPVPPSRSGCGCDVPGGDPVALSGVFAGLALALGGIYRRRTRAAR